MTIITLDMVVDTIINQGIIAGLELDKLRKIQECEAELKRLGKPKLTGIAKRFQEDMIDEMGSEFEDENYNNMY